MKVSKTGRVLDTVEEGVTHEWNGDRSKGIANVPFAIGSAQSAGLISRPTLASRSLPGVSLYRPNRTRCASLRNRVGFENLTSSATTSAAAGANPHESRICTRLDHQTGYRPATAKPAGSRIRTHLRGSGVRNRAAQAPAGGDNQGCGANSGTSSTPPLGHCKSRSACRSSARIPPSRPANWPRCETPGWGRQRPLTTHPAPWESPPIIVNGLAESPA